MFGTRTASSVQRNSLPWWPSACAVCRSWPAHTICIACRQQFVQPTQRCDTCARELLPGHSRCGRCLTQAVPLEACFAAVAYRYPWSELIADFKFRGQPALAGPLARLLLATDGVPALLAQTQIVLPMPLFSARLAERGYNQALLLARALAPQTTRADVLLRVRDTAPQLALDRAARMANVQQAFAVDPLQVAHVAQRRVVLVDDVMTSGASLYAASQTLRHAGAASVSAVVLARTPEGH